MNRPRIYGRLQTICQLSRGSLKDARISTKITQTKLGCETVIPDAIGILAVFLLATFMMNFSAFASSQCHCYEELYQLY